MCYKATITKKAEAIAESRKVALDPTLNFTPSYHINAFTNPEILIIPLDDPKHIYSATWGLVPFWGKKDPIEFLSGQKYTLNCRGEDMFETKSYKNHVEDRCLILFDGFYEPHHYQKQIQPYFCYIPGGADVEDRALFSVAGLYSKIQDNYYVTLVTTEANDFFAEVHNNKKRMPLVLDHKYEGLWLEEGQNNSILESIVKEGFTTSRFEAYPVTNEIYKKNLDSRQIINPVASIEPETLF